MLRTVLAVMSGYLVFALGEAALMVAHGGAMESTGLYAGISRQQFPEWASNVLGNGGVPRPLTVDLMAQLEANVFTACGEPANLVLASAGVVRRYENFSGDFSKTLRFERITMPVSIRLVLALFLVPLLAAAGR